MTDKLQYRIDYIKTKFDELEQRNYRIASNKEEADEAELYIIRYNELYFIRKENGEWPYEMDKVIRMLEQAFEQGRTSKKKEIAETLKKVIGI